MMAQQTENEENSSKHKNQDLKPQPNTLTKIKQRIHYI